MNLTPYKKVFALPGVTMLLLVGSAARFPVAAAGMTLLFHIRDTLGRNYLQAGLVAAALTVGAAVGSTVSGRIIDKIGLRPVMITTTITASAFWLSATLLPYEALLAVAFPAGLLSLPAFGAIRQGLAAMVPVDMRRTAYSLDSMGVEFAFIVAPAAAIFVATANSHIALIGVGCLVAVSGSLLIWLNPPTKSAAELAEMAGQARPPRSTWLRGPMVAMLIGAVAATVALAGGEVSMVALLTAHGQASQAGIVLGMWAAFSLVGGFLYGSLAREFHPMALLAAMCLGLLPIALATQWWIMAIVLIPAGLLCAPALTSMVDRVSQIVPAAVRGEAMGLHGSAITIGGAIGAPVVGAIIDRFGPGWGFVVAGGAGVLIALAGWLLMVLWTGKNASPGEPVAPVRAGDALPEAA
ncbi:MFS transporter [Phytomonospora sp. NPDC050363]|uniref:MFS transporter n=1 Tax=Phytomonospora sp. NPDC050363 TaxID=3155642 RepID=UPI0033F20148